MDGQTTSGTSGQHLEGRGFRRRSYICRVALCLGGVLQKDEQIKKLKPNIGDLVLDNDIVREALKLYPLDRKTSDT